MRLQQPWSTVMPTIIDVAERDRDLEQLQSQISRTNAGSIHHRNRQERGELPRSQDARELIASILGPICTGVSSRVSRLTKLSQKKGGRARPPQCSLICG
jgi:hypothetical protein